MNTLVEEKLFYERFWALLADRDLMRVFEHFGPAAFRRSSVLEGFELFIKAQTFRGRTCVEIGTLKGLTAVVLARYFERVVTLDIVEDPQRREIVSLLGVGNIQFVNVNDNGAKARAIDALEFDAAYIDGDHVNDTETDFALVRKCGRVLFHEHWDAQPAVVQLVTRLGGVGLGVVVSGKLALWTA